MSRYSGPLLPNVEFPSLLRFGIFAEIYTAITTIRISDVGYMSSSSGLSWIPGLVGATVSIKYGLPVEASLRMADFVFSESRITDAISITDLRDSGISLGYIDRDNDKRIQLFYGFISEASISNDKIISVSAYDPIGKIGVAHKKITHKTFPSAPESVLSGSEDVFAPYVIGEIGAPKVPGVYVGGGSWVVASHPCAAVYGAHITWNDRKRDIPSSLLTLTSQDGFGIVSISGHSYHEGEKALFWLDGLETSVGSGVVAKSYYDVFKALCSLHGINVDSSALSNLQTYLPSFTELSGIIGGPNSLTEIMKMIFPAHSTMVPRFFSETVPFFEASATVPRDGDSRYEEGLQSFFFLPDEFIMPNTVIEAIRLDGGRGDRIVVNASDGVVEVAYVDTPDAQLTVAHPLHDLADSYAIAAREIDIYNGYSGNGNEA
ncbi:hypothetical protein D6779_11065 [Candidatus Parcubacteria bacterium]|nr:MAG: hypothetical protein D6779_11065 [Candidatus Parcubacteria bacterium]